MRLFFISLIVLVAVLLASYLIPHTSIVFAQTSANWFMAGANPQRTSWITNAPTNITGIQWYRPIEAYIDQKTQIVTGNRHLYISTTGGLIVLDAENGNLAWRYDTEMPLGQAPTIIGSMVYFGGYDRKITALEDQGNSYRLVWQFTQSTGGFSTNPLVVNNTVYLGSRDGIMYALNTQTGAKVWQYPSTYPSPLISIMYSPAYTNGNLYFAGQDMHAYALNAVTGNLVWKSAQKLPGESYQSWWPVILDNYVIFSGAPGYNNETDPGTLSVAPGVQKNLKGFYRDTFFGTSSGNVGPSATGGGSTGWASGLNLIDSQAASAGVPYSLSGYFTQYPQRKVYVVLDQATGQETVTMPFIYAHTYSGNVYPPIVNPNTGAAYAKALFSGTGGGYQIARSQLLGWKPGNRYLHNITHNKAVDEPESFSGAGTDTYFDLCCDRESGYASSGNTWWNYGGAMLENLLPAQGATNAYDPMWRKYTPALQRLGAYYKGDSRRTNNTDSRNGIFNSHGLQNPPIPYIFTNESGQTVNRIFMHRSNTIIALGPTAAKTPLGLVDLNPNPSNLGTSLTPAQIMLKLETEIDKVISVYEINPNNGFLNPGYYNDGTTPAFMPPFYFQNPADGLAVLSRAYVRLTNSSLKSRLSTYLNAYYQHYFGATPITVIGWTNQNRNAMDYPADLLPVMEQKADSSGLLPIHSFYALGLYATAFPNQALTVYNAHQNRLQVPSNLSSSTLTQFPYQYNQTIAGYQGFLQLQTLAGRATADADLRNRVQNELNNLRSNRSQNFAKDMPWYGELDNPSGPTPPHTYIRQYNLSRNFLDLTQELGAYFRQNQDTLTRNAFQEYTYLNPFWFTGATDNAFQEGTKHNLYDNPALFAAKAYLTGANQPELSKYIDTPTFARGDWYFIGNLLTTLEAPSDPNYTPPPQPSATPAPVYDFVDYWARLMAFGTDNPILNLTGTALIDIFDLNAVMRNL